MKIARKIIITLVVIVVVLVAGKNIIVKAAVENGVQAATGLPLKISKLNIEFVNSRIGIEGLSVFNPKDFPKEVMFHAPEIYVDYRLGEIIGGKIHLEELRLDFDRFVIVKNEQGRTNLEALKPKESQTQKTSDVKDDGKAQKTPKFQIDRLSLKVGKVIYKDYSKGGEPTVKEFNMNITEEMTDVNDTSILTLVATKVLAKTAISNLAGINVDMLGDATAIPGQVVGSLKDTTGKISESLKDTIKLPFGNK